MKKRMKQLTAFLCAVAMCFSMSACGGTKSNNSSKGDTQSDKRTDINLLITDAFSAIDPHNLALNSDKAMCRQIYEPLYWIDREGKEVPMLATEYSVSEDQLIWTFKLREGVTFHNGDTLKAGDVVYSYNRCMESAYMQSFTESIDKVEAPDDTTVLVTLKSPCAPLIGNLSEIGIVSEKYAEENKDDQGLLGFKECGTGAYMYKSSTPDVKVELEAYSGYWGGEPSIKQINYNVITDTTTALTAFKSGEIDVIAAPATDAEEIVASSEYSTKVIPTNHVTYLIFNSQTEPFNNKLLRQAIAYAIDRQSIIDMAAGGAATPALSLATSYSFGYTKDHTSYEYDTDKAKKLLAEAGYPDGLDIGAFKTMSGSEFEKVAQVVQSQLAQVGITCTIEGLEGNALVNDCITGNFTLADMGQMMTSDYDYVKTFFNEEYIDGFNMARYTDPEISKLFEEGISTADKDARQEIYKQTEELIQEACVYVPIYNLTNTYAWNKDLNYEPSVFGVLVKDFSWK